MRYISEKMKARRPLVRIHRMLGLGRTMFFFGVLTSSAWGAYEGYFEGEPDTKHRTKVTLEYELDQLVWNPLVPRVPHPQIEYYTLRLEKPFKLSEHWDLATRFDLISAYSNRSSPDNPNGDYESGMYDSLAQGLFVYNASKRWSLLAGLRTWWPTGTQDQFGLGKIQTIPIAGFICQLPEISKGSNFAPQVRYVVDVGGIAGRRHINRLQFRPMLNIELPKGFTATLFPSADIIVDMSNHKNRWFVPFNGMLSKTLTKNTVLYVECGVPIVKVLHYYNFKILTGLSVSF